MNDLLDRALKYMNIYVALEKLDINHFKKQTEIEGLIRPKMKRSACRDEIPCAQKKTTFFSQKKCLEPADA